MLHACVQKFDMTGTFQIFLELNAALYMRDLPISLSQSQAFEFALVQIGCLW